MNLEVIEKLINMVNKSNLEGLKIETDGMKIILTNRTPASASASLAETRVEGADVALETTDDDECLYITSPLVGVFKSLASTDKPAVKVGDSVEVGQPVCVVEAMKLINEIESEHTGEIVEILVSEGDTVEYGQKLFKIK